MLSLDIKRIANGIKIKYPQKIYSLYSLFFFQSVFSFTTNALIIPKVSPVN